MATSIVFDGRAHFGSVSTPIKGIISYLSPGEALTQAEFSKSQLIKKYWLFEEDEGTKHQGKKCRDPDCLFKIFGVWIGESVITVREQMLRWVSEDTNKFSLCSGGLLYI